MVKKAILTTTIVASAVIAGATAVDAGLGDQPLSHGMRHQDVIELQNALKQKGYFTYHTSTGFYGDITKQAVERFQQANQLPKTGVADKQTLAVLTKTINPASSQGSSTAAQPAPQPTSNTTLKVGSRGQAVTDLQNALRKAGVFHQSATGYYGPITEKAVKQFQLRNGLSTTGMADGRTQEALRTSQQTTSRSQPTAQTLSIGSRGQAVMDLQKLLDQAKLFNYHSYTGYYGEVTAKGIREFQKKRQLPITGIADPVTVQALRDFVTQQTNLTNQASPTNTNTTNQTPASQQPAATPPSNETSPVAQESPAPTTTETETSFLLKVGSTGEAVRELQHQLTALGFLKAEATGYFGPATEEAIKQFQQQHGLIADGLATTKVIQKLVEETTKQLMPTITLPSETRDAFHVLNVVADGSELLGTPYLWGGTTSAGFDCSGFIQYIFQKNTISLPRTVAEMWQVGTEVTDLQVGDLVFFETYMPGPSHAGIYIGNNQFIHSSSSLGVSISNLNSSYYSPRYLGAKRYHQ